MPSPPAASLLAYWLRFGGVVCALALVAVVMPRSWHVAAHTWLGLGDFPEAPIAEYLARGMSAMCGLYGLLLIWLARDVPRFASVIRFLVVALMAVSLASTAVMASAGMPLWWLWGDIGSVWAFGLVTLLLQRGVSDRLNSKRPP
jgi:hypothetical protein